MDSGERITAYVVGDITVGGQSMRLEERYLFLYTLLHGYTILCYRMEAK